MPNTWATTSDRLYKEAFDSFLKRDYAKASASLDQINPADQRKSDILNLRGAIYKRLGQLDNAANAYLGALAITPEDWVPKYNLAEIYFLRREYKAARVNWEQILATMPKADRLQKEDLIVYKVYLTYLLQGDDEKARLLLDSFDINSTNPTYYYARAAWSYQKQDTVKAGIWIDSANGIYPQSLRIIYRQALVDVGWLKPSAGSAFVPNVPDATPVSVAPAPPISPAAAVVIPSISPAILSPDILAVAFQKAPSRTLAEPISSTFSYAVLGSILAAAFTTTLLYFLSVKRNPSSNPPNGLPEPQL